MEDISKTDTQAMVDLLEKQGAANVVSMDVRNSSSWTDFMIVATVTSQVQARGLEKYILEEAHKQGREMRRGSSRSNDETWHLFDCGDLVINLMTQESREFYQLEALWIEPEENN